MREESGAVAVLVTILAVVLIGVGALAVDLGNAFARKRVSQTQADLAALAGAAELPNKQAAIDEAFDYLVKNSVLGQDGSDLVALKTQMTNGVTADGEICVGDLTAAGCTEDLNLVSVLTPDAQVDYALGGVFNQNGIDVDAYAQAGIFSPGKIAPFFVPWGCSQPLPNQIFVKSGAESVPTEPSPVLKTPMASKNGAPSVDTVDPSEVAFGPAANLRTVTTVSMGANSTTLTTVANSFTVLDVGAQIKVFGAAVRKIADASMTVGDARLSSATANFTDADVGATVKVLGGGPGPTDDLTAQIVSRQSPTEVTLEVAAGKDVTNGTATLTPASGADLVTTVAAYVSTTRVTLAKAASSDVADGTAEVTQASSLKVEVTGDDFTDNTDPAAAALEVWFIRGAQAFKAIATGADVVIDKYNNPRRDSAMVTVPADVLNQSASAWYIQVGNLNPLGGVYSFSEEKTNVAILKVSSSASASDQCGVRATGDFGLLNSPRADTNQNQARLDLNIAEGLDHAVQVFPNVTAAGIDPLGKDNCRITPQQPVNGGILDDDATVAGGGIPNCLEINNGNKVDAATDGLIKGGNNPRSFDGRLDAAASSNCVRPSRNALGVDINDDVLSCFLQNGTLQGAINGTDPKFDASIVDSPRFMFVPVLYASINPQNGFYPIQRFAGAFITEQPITTGPGTSPTVNADNGVVVGSQKVEGINVMPFELDRLPEQIDYAGQVIPYIGAGPKVVRLIK
jgi:hypothetical protein